MAQGNQGELYLSALPNNQFHLRPEVSKVRRRAQLQLCSQTQAGDRAVFKEQVMHNKFNPSDCCATADFRYINSKEIGASTYEKYIFFIAG